MMMMAMINIKILKLEQWINKPRDRKSFLENNTALVWERIGLILKLDTSTSVGYQPYLDFKS